jgi:hypothetical protein
MSQLPYYLKDMITGYFLVKGTKKFSDSALETTYIKPVVRDQYILWKNLSIYKPIR